jgi:hypothetical protein
MSRTELYRMLKEQAESHRSELRWLLRMVARRT